MNLIQLPKDWEQFIEGYYSNDDFTTLIEVVNRRYDESTCYPPKQEIFNAFKLCPVDQIKVVLIGQDPYHGVGQANGLAFSVNDGIAFPPSLVNIFKELESDLGIPIPISGNLERWAAQGVLLLNATLTVKAGEAGSHQQLGWEEFTDAIIKALSSQKNKLVFLLWGGFAKKKVKLIANDKNHLILTSGHPSPLSANRGHWFGNRHFSKTNDFLTTCGITPIDF